MEKDALAPTELRVDGGMVINDWLAQSLADLLQLPVVRPETVETTALGAAFLAGLTAGVYASLDDIASRWRAQTRRSEEHTSELQSLMRTSYAVFCLKKKTK